MDDKRTNLEIIAPTVEEAVEKGLGDLGLPRESVEIEILDEGSKGLFGLGNRQARIRLTVKSADSETEPDSSTVETESIPDQVVAKPPLEKTLEPPAEDVEPPFMEDDYILEVARDVVSELLEKMQVRAEVSAEYLPAEDARSRIPVRVNVQGDDLSYLIGRQAETLNALQYISSLIINKEIGRSIPLIVDVEGYRARRENQLSQLAHRMADQAVASGRRQVLEPMPANERRLVHIALRENTEVTTESIGEDPRRKVTINPK